MTKKQISTAIVAGLMAMGAGAMVTSFIQPEPEQAAQVQQVAQVVEQKPRKAIEPQQKVVEQNKVEAHKPVISDKEAKILEGLKNLRFPSGEEQTLETLRPYLKYADSIKEKPEPLLNCKTVEIFCNGTESTLVFEQGYLVAVFQEDLAKKVADYKPMIDSKVADALIAKTKRGIFLSDEVVNSIGVGATEVSAFNGHDCSLSVVNIWKTTEGKYLYIEFKNVDGCFRVVNAGYKK